MDPMLLRALERILAVLLGGLAIYLGYRLFLQIPKEKDGQGKLVLPGGISIYVTRVGPGVFFALFGAVVVGMSLAFAIHYAKDEVAAGSAPHAAEKVAAARVTYNGAAPSWARRSAAKTPLDIQLEIELLNALPQHLRTDLPEARRKELDVRVTQIKLALLQAVWPKEWGDFAAFQEWAEAGAAGAPPAHLAEAAALYRLGE
jgi:hypothetical protein